MSPAFEGYLARLYTDATERERFLADPRGTASAAGLPAADLDALERIDRDGLILAAESFRRKRASKDAHAPSSLFARLRRCLRAVMFRPITAVSPVSGSLLPSR